MEEGRGIGYNNRISVVIINQIQIRSESGTHLFLLLAWHRLVDRHVVVFTFMEGVIITIP